MDATTQAEPTKRKAPVKVKKITKPITVIHSNPKVKPGRAVAVARVDVAPMSDTQRAIAMIGELSRDKSVSADKIAVSWQVMQEMLAVQRKTEFDSRFAQMWPELPRVTKDRKIVIYPKGTTAEQIESGKVRPMQSTPYATLENIQKMVGPVLARHGFKLQHAGITPINPAWVRVRSTLSGYGFDVISEFEGPPDTSGSKNGTQAVGSTMTYGIRHNSKALLNLIIEGEDKDGRVIEGRVTDDASSTALVTDEQATTIINKIEEVGARKNDFLSYMAKKAGMDIKTVAAIPAALYADAINALDQKAKASK